MIDLLWDLFLNWVTNPAVWPLTQHFLVGVMTGTAGVMFIHFYVKR